MLYPKNRLYQELLGALKTIPVIDCHEHMMGPANRTGYREPIAALARSYILNDLASAGFGIPQKTIEDLSNDNLTTDDKWPVFSQLWKQVQHTAYARVTRMVLRDVYGEPEMTREALDRVADKLSQMDEAAYIHSLEEVNIKTIIVDVLGWLPEGLGSFLSGKTAFPSLWRPMISLPMFHPVNTSWTNIQSIGALVDHHITSLVEYLEAIFMIFQRCIEKGAIGIKDQSAYERQISYELVTQADAEKLFNRLLADPRTSLGWPESKPLNDFLFHTFMRFARELKLPVQLHTGHMAGVFNRVDKTNAANLASILELHQEVRFDLFHGNWPYVGDLLFLGKNYPNVSLDLCWLHIIDPAYAIELMERAVLTMPHSKIHAFGGDYGDEPEFSAAHLQIALQNLAAALTNLVESGWMDENQAIVLAKDWLFNNPNRFFNLGFSEI